MDFRADGRLSIVSPHGVLFSSDYGNTFKEIKPVDFEVPFGYYGSTAVGPDNIVFISSAGGCWRSADAGTTWSKVTDSITLREMICPNTGPFLALAYENNASSVYLSFDKGVTWEPIAGLQYIYALALGQDGNLYAGDNPIFKSTDGGLTWLQLPHSAPGFTQAILVNRAGHIFTEDGGGTEKIYRSIDEGQSWNALPGTGTHPSLTAISPDQRLHIGHYYGDNLVTTAPTTDIALLSGVLRFDTDADCLPNPPIPSSANG